MGFKSPIQEVERFLRELRAIIDAPTFDIDRDFILIQKRKLSDQIRYSTPYTLIDLDYDAVDVLNCLKNLTIGDYSETLFDRNDNRSPLLFVFGVASNAQEVYIKVKIKQLQQACVLCVSFHYAQYRMSHPYR